MKDIKVLVVRPNEEPVVELLTSDIDSMQRIVGGYVEIVKHYLQPDGIVCNEDGKLKELEPNRVIYRDGEPIDIILGTFFICGLNSRKNPVSLTEEKIQYYKELFALQNVPKNWNTIGQKLMKPQMTFYTF